MQDMRRLRLCSKEVKNILSESIEHVDIGYRAWMSEVIVRVCPNVRRMDIHSLGPWFSLNLDHVEVCKHIHVRNCRDVLNISECDVLHIHDIVLPYVHGGLERFDRVIIECEGELYRTLTAIITLRSLNHGSLHIHDPHSSQKTIIKMDTLDLLYMLPYNIRINWWWMFML